MALPPCTVVSETMHLSVGHGVAIASIEARVRGRIGGCTVDAGAVLRAREEGRAPPELVAFRADLDGHPAALGGPRGRVSVDVSSPAGAKVRFVAVLRGDRFAAVPLAADPASVTTPVAFRVTTESVWGRHRIAGVARWTDTGTPVVVTVDAARDRELPEATQSIERSGAIPVLIADAGPRLAGEPLLETEDARLAALARGGVDALSVLLGDLPLAIATASDAPTAIVRLREAARAARGASVAADPLFGAIGQRLTTAIATAFTTCARGTATTVPARWPAPLPQLTATGLLDDSESGCPRISDLLAVNHPDVRFGQEGSGALAEAAALRNPPRVGPLERPSQAGFRAQRRPRPLLWVALSALLGLVVAAVSLSRSGRAR